MKTIALTLTILMALNTSYAFAGKKDKGDHCSGEAQTEVRSEPEAATVVEGAPKMPRMPASDGSCSEGDVFNPTDGTCITAPSVTVN